MRSANPRATLRLGLASLVLSLGCASAPGPVIDAGLEPRVTLPLDSLPERVRLAPDQDFRAVEIDRDAHSSHHVVAIRHGETLHRHERHELIVVLIEGHGTMQLGSVRRPVADGSVFYVPRGAKHAFTNQSGAPATAYVIYVPPFDGEDRAAAD